MNTNKKQCTKALELSQLYTWKNNVIKKNYKINIIMTNKRIIRILNKKYRKINKKTDVLSFTNKHKKTILGDLVLCKEVIKNIYLKKTLIHGLLHLLNYDHIKKLDKKIMICLEDKIGMSGIEPPTITTSK